MPSSRSRTTLSASSAGNNRTAPVRETGNCLRQGAPADIAIIDGNPLDNFKVMYGTGVNIYGEDGKTVTPGGGVRWTIKGGVVFDCKELLEEVAEYVKSQGPKKP